MDSETFATASRRHIRPTAVGAGVAKTFFETSYQQAYFPQSGKPVNHVTAGTRVDRHQPKFSSASSSVGEVIAQSNTTMKDSTTMNVTSFRNPKQKQESPSVRFEKIQQPKATPTQYPVPLQPCSRKLTH